MSRVVAIIAIFLGLLAFEGGFFGSVFSPKCVVEDGIVGKDYYIHQVDGMPVERIKHGLLVSRVPFALIEPGKRTLTISEKDESYQDLDHFEFTAILQKRTNYELVKNDKGEPELIKN